MFDPEARVPDIKYFTDGAFSVDGTLFEYSESGGTKINAIKFVRQQYSIGLKDAKDLVDAAQKLPMAADNYSNPTDQITALVTAAEALVEAQQRWITGSCLIIGGYSDEAIRNKVRDCKELAAMVAALKPWRR